MNQRVSGTLRINDVSPLRNPARLAVIDEADSITLGIDIDQPGMRVSVGVRISANDLDALQEEIRRIRTARGF